MLKTAVTKENVLYIVNVVVTLLVLFWLYSIVATVSSSKEAITTMTLVVTYAVVIILYIFFAKGIMVGHFRGNGIRVSEQQFPEVYAVYQAELQKLGIRKEPKLYCVQSNGVLNAFATRMIFQNYVVIYTEVLQAAYEKGVDAVAFVLAHELGHITRGHLIKNFFIYPAAVIFPVRLAYSRACEYTCDLIGRQTTSAKGVDGLVILAAGRKLGGRVNIPEYVQKARDEHGFWVWFAEFMSTHPNLPKRIGRLQSFDTTPTNP
jgi:Zn-dependent protease with chaperone function